MLNFEWLTSEFLCTVCDISSPGKIKKYSSKKSRNLQSSSITEIESTVKGMFFSLLQQNLSELGVIFLAKQNVFYLIIGMPFQTRFTQALRLVKRIQILEDLNAEFMADSYFAEKKKSPDLTRFFMPPSPLSVSFWHWH